MPSVFTTVIVTGRVSLAPGPTTTVEEPWYLPLSAPAAWILWGKRQSTRTLFASLPLFHSRMENLASAPLM